MLGVLLDSCECGSFCRGVWALLMVCSLGAVYESGNFRMSTWLPMIWGGVNVMVLILTSFPMQGGL